MHDNLLAIDPTLLPDDGPDGRARAALEAGKDPRDVAAAFPASSYVWAILGHVALDDDPVAAYAFARTGYHRGLDSLRKGGWRGQGPVPLSHEPNHGVILAVLVLREAARAIGETDEVTRLDALARDFDPNADSLLDTL
jgi:hypothetical protein